MYLTRRGQRVAAVIDADDLDRLGRKHGPGMAEAMSNTDALIRH